MSLPSLTVDEQDCVAQCLAAAEREDVFPQWEFQTLFGIERTTLKAVRERWPAVDWNDEDVQSAVVGALNHLLGYPHGLSLDALVQSDEDQVVAVLFKVTGRADGGYFDFLR